MQTPKRRIRATTAAAKKARVSSARDNDVEIKVEPDIKLEPELDIKPGPGLDTELDTELDIKPDPDVKPPEIKPELDTAEPDIEDPPHWREIYSRVKEMRAATPAPVDTVGCERIPDQAGPLTPKQRRFQLLIALMLSSQTKDEVNAATMAKLRRELAPAGGLTLEGIRNTDVDQLDEWIYQVGFHTKKARYIKDTVEILKEKFNGDIPESIADMISLPGVGPKMAYLLRTAAWNKTDGIGVDVHVHRLANMWGWVPAHKTKTPEKTRAALESWLPKDRWREINPLLVGFGQTICTPQKHNCNLCTLADGLCPSAKRKA